jgi:hypothetical protein
VTVRDDKLDGSSPESARADQFDAGELRSLRPSVRMRGRNLTKADLSVYRAGSRHVAVKDYGRRPWAVRHTLGRWLVRREVRAYRALDGTPGVPRLVGRVSPFAFATEWIDARPLPELAPERVDPGLAERLAAVLAALHGRGVALADLHHRDCLVDAAGDAWIVDYATSVVLGPRPGPLRRRLFERVRQADWVALARIRARCEGRDEEAAPRGVGSGAERWHRRGRALKRVWNALRGRVEPGRVAPRR